MKKHIHKYVRVQLKFAKVWKCNLPNCTHWMPPHQEEVIKGRMSICWGCSEPFILEEQAMQDDQPKCFTCREPEEFTNILRDDALDDYLKRDKLG